MACNHACRPTPTGGGVCYCKVGYMLNPADNYTCIGKDFFSHMLPEKHP